MLKRKMSSSYLDSSSYQTIFIVYYLSPAVTSYRQFEGVSFCFLYQFALPEFTISETEALPTVPIPSDIRSPT